MSILQARQLSIGYHGKVVGAAIDLHLAQGEVLCLLGANGAGKSTLLRTLLGLLPPLCGGVWLDGQPLASFSRNSLARQLAYVPQAQAAVFALAVLDVVLLGRLARIGRFATPRAQDRQVAEECLSRLGIACLAQRNYATLSGGERQLVLIARALAQQPALLIMDEPTASLDFANQLQVLAQLRVLREQGLGILFCTHQPEHALHVADRLVLYRQGRVLNSASPGEALSVPHLAWLYDLSEAQVARQLQHLGTLASHAHTYYAEHPQERHESF